MKSFLSRIRNHRFGLVALLAFILVSISFITRLTLLITSFDSLDCSFLTIVGIFFIGMSFDLVNATYFIVPLLIYLWLVPECLFGKSWHKYILYVLLFFFTALLTFNSFSEWFFWDEFSTRFNFIAVDYLVYTTEVIGNIQQSYPVEWYLAGAFGLTALIVFKFRSWAVTSPT